LHPTENEMKKANTSIKLVVESPSNSRLLLRSWTFSGANPRGVVQICHGMSEHSGRYDRFAQALNSAGYFCYAHDHRGHGETEAIDSKMGLFAHKDGLGKVSQDIGVVNQHIEGKHPDLPVVLLGHSMGAILAMFHACQQQATGLAGLAILNSGTDGGALLAIYRGLLRVERAMLGSKSASKVARALTFQTWNMKFAPNRTEYDWLSRDEAEVDKYIADPLCGIHGTNSLWFDVTSAIRYCANDASLKRIPKALPVFLLGGGSDPCTNKGQAMKRLEARMKKAAISDVTCEILPDTRHESLNELNREQTTNTFIQWLDDRLESPS